MRETTDTNDSYPDQDIPDGAYTFKVESVVKRYGGVSKDKPFYSWKLTYEGIKGEQVLMPNKMGDLLRVLGCTEITKGKYEWDTELVVGQYFEAVVTHETDKKGVLRQQMGNFKKANVEDDVPFGN